ncbi:MAG TPA: tannase/feruloyl esterase family alpha/beta hydrolase [Acidobacteriaceae bacterium]|nr:tannase/feruloyl esterase family alpha/beta hydrolase [Acidobacteriaceae bacterium]
MTARWLLLLLLALSASAAPAQPAEADGEQRCSHLTQAVLPDTTIVSAEIVPAGSFTLPNSRPGEKLPPAGKDLPAFCRVAAKAAPSPDSDISIEVWMPLSGWNGRFKGAGNGGFAGSINYPALSTAIRQGYAAASTDTGHAETGASWALGHPEKVIDYGYRGIHEMTVVAKSLLQAFYGQAPQRAYFAGCSNGGREALMEAERFPADYDGILAGAPANAWVPMLTAGLKLLQSMDDANYIPPEKIDTLDKAVLRACDAKDGVADGVLNDPRQCHFDPASLLCKGANSPACFTEPQVTLLKSIYAGARDAHGRLIFPGDMPGGETGRNGWVTWITGPEEGKSLGNFFVTGFFSDMVFANAKWNYKTANLGQGLAAANKTTGHALNALDPDLKPFMERGGKLILYHGWNDPAISPLNSVGYYESVVSTLGAPAAEKFVRLYMAPGMQHCAGGPGANVFGQGDGDPKSDAGHDIFAALQQWVEKGPAPSSIIATKYVEDDPAKGVQMTRPLCPYPEAAKYLGTGDSASAASFACSPAK